MAMVVAGFSPLALVVACFLCRSLPFGDFKKFWQSVVGDSGCLD